MLNVLPRLASLFWCLLLPVVGAETVNTQLWYRQPAKVWTEALPVGNGSLGAMVFGEPSRERLQVNHDTLWTGQPHAYHRDGAAELLPTLRQLLREGRQKEAEELAMQRFMSDPLRQMMYQPFFDVWIESEDLGDVTDYRRQLDLSEACVSVQFRSGGVSHQRQTFSSHPGKVIVHRLSADQPGKINLRLRLSTEHGQAVVQAKNDGTLELKGRVGTEGTRFAARVEVRAQGGSVSAAAEHLVVTGADEVVLLIGGTTSFLNYRDVSGDPEAALSSVFAAVKAKSYKQLHADHVADHRHLFDRVALDLGSTLEAERPTDERLAAGAPERDPALAALLFNFGRYLLIASSRPGSQAANLQGIWNHQLNPPWGSKYTTNINLEMNYWPAEVANLAECAEPLFRLIEEVAESGRETARAHWGAGGWVLHHNTDLWRGTAPINHSNHGIWPTGGAWLCLHLWERYRFSGDRDFLTRAYPLLRDASRFFLDTLVQDPETGWWISGPSNSPEHGGLVMGPTMDHQLIRGLFSWTAQAARLLDRDEDLVQQLDAVRAKIAPNQIGRLGQLQEWLEDRDDPNNRHRHVSHLWGVFPGEDITSDQPELMTAARRSLELRGDGGTGWSLGWKIALWARFRDGDHAHRILMHQLRLVRERADGKTDGGGGTYPNLFDAHPPFQIDGNFAATAGIIEMLVQSHPAKGEGRHGELHLLPALPRVWSDGSIRGVRARGGVEVDLSWRGGELESAKFTASAPVELTVRHADHQATLALRRGESVTLGPELERH